VAYVSCTCGTGKTGSTGIIGNLKIIIDSFLRIKEWNNIDDV